jgi:hypothetical protein
MAGLYEARATGPGRAQFRLFCLLDRADESEMQRRGLTRPAIAVLTGLVKPWRSTFDDRDYQAVRALGDEYRATYPRRIAR